MTNTHSINGNCSLNMGTTINSSTDKWANRTWNGEDHDALWFERDFKKGADYRPGLVTVIKFDYLEQQ